MRQQQTPQRELWSHHYPHQQRLSRDLTLPPSPGFHESLPPGWYQRKMSKKLRLSFEPGGTQATSAMPVGIVDFSSYSPSCLLGHWQRSQVGPELAPPRDNRNVLPIPITLLRKLYESPSWCDSVDWVLTWESKGHWFDSQSRAHAWVEGQVPRRECVGGNHTLMLLSLSFSFPSLL